MNYIKKTHISLPKTVNSLTNEQIYEYIKSHQSNPRDKKSPKPTANLNDKEQHVLHMKNFTEYLQAGLVLKNHGVIKCKQSRWLKHLLV